MESWIDNANSKSLYLTLEAQCVLMASYIVTAVVRIILADSSYHSSYSSFALFRYGQAYLGKKPVSRAFLVYRRSCLILFCR